MPKKIGIGSGLYGKSVLYLASNVVLAEMVWRPPQRPPYDTAGSLRAEIVRKLPEKH